MPDKEPPDLVKEAINNAIKEWMDEKYRAVGRNTVHCICILGFCLFVRALIHFHMLDVDGILAMTTGYQPQSNQIR